MKVFVEQPPGFAGLNIGLSLKDNCQLRLHLTVFSRAWCEPIFTVSVFAQEHGKNTADLNCLKGKMCLTLLTGLDCQLQEKVIYYTKFHNLGRLL